MQAVHWVRAVLDGLPHPTAYLSYEVWEATRPKDEEPITTQDLVQPASPGEPEAVDLFARLRNFYSVSTDAELIDEMERHIEKLQARLLQVDPTAHQPVITRVREG